MSSISLLFLFLLLLSSPQFSTPQNSNHFTEYIGAEFTGVRFSDLPIIPSVNFHFLLSFAIDYTTSAPNTPTNGQFHAFWDTQNLSPSSVQSIKSLYSNVRIGVSLGGDSIGNANAFFQPTSIDSWVANAVSSLTEIARLYNLDGLDIDYEHFRAEPDTFAECIGRLVKELKQNGVIKFASIAPFDDEIVQEHYEALWRKYGEYIDYVNFQFYAYEKGLTVSQFMKYFNEQRLKYNGGKILASISTEKNPGGLTPENGFFRACDILKKEGKLEGIFIWSADNSKSNGFRYEKQAQSLLAGPK